MSRKRDRFAYNRPPEGQPFIWMTRAMLESPAWRAMPINARKVVDRIALEHLAHGGVQNGELPVTYDNFQDSGIRRGSIAEALATAISLGFVDIVVLGVRAYGAHRASSQYGLTWLGIGRMSPTNRWRNLATLSEAKAAVREARRLVREARRLMNDRRKRRADIESSPTIVTGTAAQISAVASSDSGTGVSHKSGTGKSAKSVTGQTPPPAKREAQDVHKVSSPPATRFRLNGDHLELVTQPTSTQLRPPRGQRGRKT